MRKILLTILAFLGAYAAQAQCNTSFVITSVNGLNVTVTNNSQVSLVPGSTPTTWYTWGDGSSATVAWYAPGTTASHTYSSTGTYNIILHTYYYDSLNNVTVCNDTVGQNVTVGNICAATISTTNNGGGSYSFNASVPGATSAVTYLWNFGDGSTSTSGPGTTHTYATSGNYTVTLVTATGGLSCTTSINVNYFNGVVNCNTLNAAFTSSVTGNVVAHFSNNSTQANYPGAFIYTSSNWNFGDGNTSTAHSPTHAYSAPGTYTVSLVVQWVDSSTQSVYCTDTAYGTVTVTTPPNLISGSITWDSTINVWSSAMKVWLITYDATTNIIDAVDSQTVSGSFNQITYTFNNVPAGDYRVKAAVLSGAAGANLMAPTYHFGNTYWGSATVINHTGGSSTNKHIWMQSGSSTSGPGFISGNVTMGAGKGTGAGVPGLLVLLRDAGNNMERFTYTDINGDYSFGGLGDGTYNVYPENMPQVTTPSSALTIASGSYNVAGIDFEKTSTTIKPKTTGVENIPAANIFSIYPNPTDGIVNLNWNNNVTGKVTIKVMDMTGREVYNAAANTNAAASINMNAAPAGVYFINVVSDKAQHTQKLIIQ